MDFPIKNGDFPLQTLSSPQGIYYLFSSGRPPLDFLQGLGFREGFRSQDDGITTGISNWRVGATLKVKDTEDLDSYVIIRNND